jgi:hypothetical protein
MRYLKRILLFLLALLGVSMCLLCAVFDGIIPVYCSYQTDDQIEQLFADMHAAIQQEDYAAAFHHMTPSYRQSHKPVDLSNWMERTAFDLESHYYLEMTDDRAKVGPRQCRFSEFMSGPIFHLVRIDNNWYFTGEYDWPLD